MTIDKTYNPHAIETHWYPQWEQGGYFIPSGKGQPYCIMLPPPNVTGTLHMGHGFQVSLMDALIRYHRMQGYNTLWQVGTDHAGIATQMVVERQLMKQGQTRQELGREVFLQRIWDWKAQSDGTIKQQLRRMGASVDWTRERFSLDEDINIAVRDVFVRLYDEKLLYRGKRLVNWDPSLHTAVSDLEVISSEEEGHIWSIRYLFAEGEGYLTVATTRPETLLGDTAVAVNPNDPRYQAFIGKHLKLPLTERIIPIIADEMVAQDFGTGCVKITPAHDFNDYATGLRHQLPMINIFTADAHLNENTPKKYQGLERFVARTKILEDLHQLNLLEKTAPHRLNIPRGERSGVIIEPYLTDQWFIKTKSLAEPALTAARQGEIRFVPENWYKTYAQWLENIQDWCISRQLWWGHRIPAWYDAQGNIYVAHDEPEVRRKYQLADNIVLYQDEDVLDTWFSASLWPFTTLGWPQTTAELAAFYPTQVLVTGFDIVFFWVARMVMMGLKFTAQVPFRQVYITGLIRDAEGQKMSKSKGNVLDPIDLVDGITLEALLAKRTSGLMQPAMAKRIEAATRHDFPNGISAFGTDALRFTYCALASTGRDIRFDLGRIEGYRNFCNKLWNAARYVLMNTENQDAGLNDQPIEFSLPDRWIRARLQNTIQQVHQAFALYRFDLVTQTMYDFAWGDYCDWYLELCKPTLTATENNAAAKRGTRQTLVQILEILLRLLHPIMPFITEEIWQKIAPLAGKQGATIMLQTYPQFDATQHDANVLEEMQWLQRFIIGIRNIRGEMNISPSKSLPLLLHKGTAMDQQRIAKNQAFLQALAKLESLTWVASDAQPPASATTLIDELELHVPLADLIDKDAESARLQKEVSKLERELQSSTGRLKNPDYLNKAPAQVVAKEQEKVQEIAITLHKLQQQLVRLAELK
jgi:valyl-tRNA synthetase